MVPSKKTSPPPIQGSPFQLYFSAGGSITGSSFDVKVSDAHITYRETRAAGTQEVKKIDRTLSKSEYDEIQKIGADLYYLGLQTPGGDSLDNPPSTDPAAYQVTVLLDMKGSTVHCFIPTPHTKSLTACQKQCGALRLKLNSILGVNIQ